MLGSLRIPEHECCFISVYAHDRDSSIEKRLPLNEKNRQNYFNMLGLVPGSALKV